MIYQVKDIVITKKNHPCGGNRWEILRTGSDIKLKCLTCGRIVMLDLESFKKRVKRHIPQQNGKETP